MVALKDLIQYIFGRYAVLDAFFDLFGAFKRKIILDDGIDDIVRGTGVVNIDNAWRIAARSNWFAVFGL